MGKKKRNNTADATSVRDGGTGTHGFTDAAAAVKSVSRDDRIKCFSMLGAAAVTLVLLFGSRLVWLMKPLFDRVFGGLVSETFYYLIILVVFVAYMIGLGFFVRRFCGVRLYKTKRPPVELPRALGVIAVCAVAVFVTSAAFKFKLKIEYELEQGSTGTNMLVNAAIYFYYALHLLLAFISTELVQRALSTLIPAKYTVPWGAIFLVTVYGLIEFLFEYYATGHRFAHIYYLFTYVYAAIYVISRRGFHASYWASVIVMVL